MEFKQIPDLKTIRDTENATAQAMANRGLLEYVAMMADVELPEKEDENEQVR